MAHTRVIADPGSGANATPLGLGAKEGAQTWMNEGPNNTINKEEYLLGKAIGKNFEKEGTLGQINAVEYDCAPPSLFSSQAEHQVDLQRKLQEDPLVALKKREMEDRKRLMDNPVKMKALQDHIEELKKSKKKNKKKKHHRSDSDDSDGDLDLKLLKKIQKMEGGFVESDSSTPPRKIKQKDAQDDDEPARFPGAPGSDSVRFPGAPGSNPSKRRNSPPLLPQGRSPYRRRRDSSPNRKELQRRNASPQRRKQTESPPRHRQGRSPSGSHRRRKANSPPRRRQ